MCRSWTCGLLILAYLLYGCGPGAECAIDADCEPGYACVSPGGILFSGQICASPHGQPTGPMTDAGCQGPSCESCTESDASVCERTGTTCGELMAVDLCGIDRTVDCGPCGPVDTDGDGAEDIADNCPDTPNADQADQDADGVGDACDNCPTTSNEDQTNDDTDSLGNVCDNCMSRDNEDQADSNGDGIPDACTMALIAQNETKSPNTVGFDISPDPQPQGDNLLYLAIISWDDPGQFVQQVRGAGLKWTEFSTHSARSGELNIAFFAGTGSPDGTPVSMEFNGDTRTPVAQLYVFENADLDDPFGAISEDSDGDDHSASISVRSERLGDFAFVALAFDETHQYELDPSPTMRTSSQSENIRLATRVRASGDTGTNTKLSGDFNKDIPAQGLADWLGVAFLVRHAP